MDDESLKREGEKAYDLHIKTTDRVGEMSDEARVDLHREIAGRKLTYADTPARRTDVAQDPNAEIVRLTAELHSIDRRLDRLERQTPSERFRSGAGWPGSRYIRLVSRARRIERQLRELS